MPAPGDRLPASPSPLRAATTAPRRAHLRGVVGGYDIDRLPICVPRAEGEALEAWLRRAAHRYGIHPRQMLDALGLTALPQRLLYPQALFTSPGGQPAAAQLGLDAQTLTTPSALAASLQDGRRRHRQEFHRRVRPQRLRASRWCPRCLAETGIWHDSWHDPLHLYCQTHGLVLQTRCRCGGIPYVSTAWTTSTGDALTCPEFTGAAVDGGGRYRTRCRARFQDCPPTPASTSDLESQRVLHHYAQLAHREPDRLVGACGLEGQALTIYEAALEIIDTICQAHDVRLKIGEPEESLRYAVRVAAHFLTCPTPAGARAYARRHEAFGPNDDAVPLGPRATVRQAPRNPLIVAVWLSDMHERVSLPFELRFRMGSPRPRYPDGWQGHDRVLQPTDTRPGLPLAAIPQVIWPWALPLAEDADLGLDTPTGRTFVSLCLARYGTARPFGVIATALGLPGWSASRYEKHWKAIHTSGRWRQYLAGLDCLFHQLHDDPPPINYQRRRDTAFDAELLRPVADQLHARLPEDVRRRASRAQWRRVTWALYTGGDLTNAPPAHYRTDMAPTGPARPPLAKAAELIEAAWPEEFLPDSEPLVWTPP